MSVQKMGGKYFGVADTTFRLLANLSRPIAMALADGVNPGIADDEAGVVVRKMIRRFEARREFEKRRGSMETMIPVAMSSLESAYPEIRKNWKDIESILSKEQKHKD